jgi:putative redox protein
MPTSRKTAGRTWRHAPWKPCSLALAGCTAYDVVLILKRGRHSVKGCTVKLSAERANVDPKVFTRIHMHFTVTGTGVPPAAVERAVALSHEKYCSASVMLAKTAVITTSFELIEG